jgi:N-acetylmuramoyl-L-alanine amidase
MSKKVFIQAGHTLSGSGTGAIGHINESVENRKVVDSTVKWLKLGGAIVYREDVDKSNDYLNAQTNVANKYNTDIAVQIHFNSSSSPNAHGTETYYKTSNGKVYSDRVNKKLSTLFYNRGSKTHSKNLHWLRATKAPAILIETCFVSSKSDTDLYKANVDKIGKLIAEGILGCDIKEPEQDDKKTYAICVYALTGTKNADKKIEELKKQGFTSAYKILR